MKKGKQFLAGLVTSAMMLTATPTAFAAVEDTGFTDVSATAWYAQAVDYVYSNDLMSGTQDMVFSPQEEMSRAMLAAVLYRAAGSPVVYVQADFTDVSVDGWYTNAVDWAAANNVISGYGNGLFGVQQPVTREQIASILWRYVGSSQTQETQDFADEADISAYAAEAVDWAQNTGVVSGKENHRFDPKGNATRAEVAMMLYRLMTMEGAEASRPSDMENGDDTLVVYYSATGNTEAVAEKIAETLDADLFEIMPAEPYTDEDLDWTDSSSRVVAEYENPNLRTVELVSNTVENWEEYETVLIGYPIWWGIAAWPVDAFVQANDFTGKTVIPFCTSSTSGIGESGALLAETAGSGEWLAGERFRSSASERDIQEWINGLDLSAHSADLESELSNDAESQSLVVYFSMPETDDAVDMTQEEDNSVVVIDGEVLGNTQYMAYVIQEQTGADIFRIEPETPYPLDHETLVELAAEEQDTNARPAIQDKIPQIEDYDTIFVGYPIWWSDLPMILYTFFDTYDLSGKTIVPFGTHGGSGFADTIDTIIDLEPNATVLEEGLTISRNDIQDAEAEIISWVNELDV